MNIKAQKKLSLALLEWHGGMSSGLYAVGSCMFEDSEKGVPYSVARHHGHEGALGRAIAELREMKARANFPETMTPKDERECNALADKLAMFVPGIPGVDSKLNRDLREFVQWVADGAGNDGVSLQDCARELVERMERQAQRAVALEGGQSA